MPEQVPRFPDVSVSLSIGDNVFGIIGEVRRALLEAGYEKEAKEFVKAAWEDCGSYDEVVALCTKTVEVR